MFIHTRNSIYEVDKINKLIRRLLGNADPTLLQGKDNEWKSYRSLTSPGFHDIENGKEAMICWTNHKTTFTSIISKIDLDGVSN